MKFFGDDSYHITQNDLTYQYNFICVQKKNINSQDEGKGNAGNV